MQTSAKTGYNVEEVMQNLVRRIEKNSKPRIAKKKCTLF